MIVQNARLRSKGELLGRIWRRENRGESGEGRGYLLQPRPHQARAIVPRVRHVEALVDVALILEEGEGEEGKKELGLP